MKGEKSLKSVPAKLRKNKKIKELTSRKTELRRQASRMRRALEEMMVRGDAVEGHELPELFANPLLAPMVEKLVFVGDGILGYPDDGGRTLVDFAGTKEPIKKDESLRLAHAHDLYKTGKWAQLAARLFRPGADPAVQADLPRVVPDYRGGEEGEDAILPLRRASGQPEPGDGPVRRPRLAERPGGGRPQDVPRPGDSPSISNST